MLNNPKTYIFLRQFHPRPRMSTEIKATLVIKHEPEWIEICLLRERIQDWVKQYALEIESLRLELNGEEMYES